VRRDWSKIPIQSVGEEGRKCLLVRLWVALVAGGLSKILMCFGGKQRTNTTNKQTENKQTNKQQSALLMSLMSIIILVMSPPTLSCPV
jgi:hypothetical protein